VQEVNETFVPLVNWLSLFTIWWLVSTTTRRCLHCMHVVPVFIKVERNLPLWRLSLLEGRRVNAPATRMGLQVFLEMADY